MAEGDITNTPLDTYIYSDPAVVDGPALSHVIGDIWVVAYRDAGDASGRLNTFRINSASGLITKSILDTIAFDSNVRAPFILKITEGIVAVFYKEGAGGEDGFVKTIGIQSDGTITGVIATRGFSSTSPSNPHATKGVGDVVVIVYTGPDTDGWMRTITINSSGTISAIIGTFEFEADRCLYAKVARLTGDIYPIVYDGPGGTGWLVTVEIDSAGNITDPILDSLEFDAGDGGKPELLPIASDMVVVTHGGNVATGGHIRTIGIAASGAIDAAETDSVVLGTEYNHPMNFMHVSGDVYARMHVDASEDVWVRTHTITEAGAISAQAVDSIELNEVTVHSPNIRRILGTPIYVCSYYGGTQNGVLETIQIETVGNANGLAFEAAWGQAIFTASPTWTDLTPYAKSLDLNRGRKHVLGRVEAGEGSVVVDNAAGNFWRGNTAGAWYPDVKPLTLIRVGHRYNEVTRYLFWGVIESIVPDWEVPGEAGFGPKVTLGLVDMFKAFNRFDILDANPALTADSAAGQKVVDVDNASRLYIGQSIQIYDAGSSEVNEIASITLGVGIIQITMANDLANTYTVGNSAKLKKFPAVLSGTRINDVLRELGWPAALSDVDAGQVLVNAFSPPTAGTNCLAHMQSIRDVEDGLLFMRAADGFCVFQDGQARAVQPLSVSQLTFNDDDTDSKYVHPSLMDDETFLYNEARISGPSIPHIVIRDNAAQLAQGPRAWTMAGALYSLESDALMRAWIHVQRFVASILRVEALTCKPAASPDDLFPKLMGNDLSTRLTFNLDDARNPAEIAREYHIEGIKIEWDALSNEWVVKWQLWDVNQYRIVKIQHDGYVENSVGATYSLLQGAAVGDFVINDIQDIRAGQWLVHALIGGAFQAGIINRGYLELDTSALAADDTIVEAVLIFYVTAAYAESDESWDLTLVSNNTVDNPLVLADYNLLKGATAGMGSVTITPGAVGWTAISLNAAGLAHISKAGITRFALRSQEDIDIHNPGVNGNKRDFVQIAGFGNSREPRLIIRIT